MVAVVTAFWKPSVPTIPETPPAAASWAIHFCCVRFAASIFVVVLLFVAVARWLLTIVAAWVCKILFRMNVDADFVSRFPFNATFSNLICHYWLIWLLSRNLLQFLNH